jgi:hypothetical protein
MPESQATTPVASQPSQTEPLPNYVYAIGKIDFTFPDESIKRFYQNVSQAAGPQELTDRRLQHEILKEPQNKVIVRKLCWVLTVNQIPRYILSPNDPRDWTPASR